VREHPRELLDRRLAALGAVFLAAAAVVVMPWVVRNRVQVGCFALTTDARALWKANNVNTYRTLAHGHWIDDVPDLPNRPPTPQDAGEHYRSTGQIIRVDECAQADFYERKVLSFWRHHPGEKAKLAGQATWMLWDPRVGLAEGRPGEGGWLDTARRWAEPVYMVAVYALALVGLALLPAEVTALALALLAYNTLMAMVFAGTTRYRVAFDFLLVLFAAAGALALAGRVREGRAAPLRPSRPAR
jgi:hypothetical protein